MENAHEMIRRLNRSCPSLLHNVVPQLEEELRTDEVRVRQIATHVLGDMFSDKAAELEKKFPSTWSTWLNRRNDKAPIVRLAFVEGCRSLLLQPRAELQDAIEGAARLKPFMH